MQTRLKKGDRIRLVSMPQDPDPIPVGSLGTVVEVHEHLDWTQVDVDWDNGRSLSIGAIPVAIFGAVLFTKAPLGILTPGLGIALIGLVALRRTRWADKYRPGRTGWIGIGAALGLISSVVGTAGPLSSPFFLQYGLVKKAYIGTEAATALISHLTKLVVYVVMSLVFTKLMLIGTVVGIGLIIGAYVGKAIVDRLPKERFIIAVEVMLCIAGLRLLLL